MNLRQSTHAKSTSLTAIPLRQTEDDATAVRGRAIATRGARGALSWAILAGALHLAPGCEAAAGDDAAGGSDTDDQGPDEAWLELGQGALDWQPLDDTHPFQLWLGGQGTYMFPLQLRVGNIVVPNDPLDWEDPWAPELELEWDVPEHNVGLGGYFYRIANYPLPLKPHGDGYEWSYVALILPDPYYGDPAAIDGVPGTLTVHVTAADGESVTVSVPTTLNTSEIEYEPGGETGDATQVRPR